jgi:hypothetical protein
MKKLNVLQLNKIQMLNYCDYKNHKKLSVYLKTPITNKFLYDLDQWIEDFWKDIRFFVSIQEDGNRQFVFHKDGKFLFQIETNTTTLLCGPGVWAIHIAFVGFASPDFIRDMIKDGVRKFEDIPPLKIGNPIFATEDIDKTHFIRCDRTFELLIKKRNKVSLLKRIYNYVCSLFTTVHGT